MEIPGLIDIEGKTLAYTGNDVNKLTTDQGCVMKVVTDKIYDLDDSFETSDNENDDTNNDEHDESQENVDQQAKINRLHREFISLTLNANRDPIKPNSSSALFKSMSKRYYQDASGLFEANEDDYTKYDDDSELIHKRYSSMGNYEVMLKDDKVEEVSPGRVYKRRTVLGTGRQVDDNSLVIYNCAQWTENAKDPFDSTWLRHETYITNLSKDSILPGLMELLLTMRQGEWCEAFLRPEAAYGRHGCQPRIPANATVFCLVEMVKVVPLDHISLLSMNPTVAQNEDNIKFEDFYAASDEARRRGNYYYDIQQYRIALQRYKSGIRILEALTYKNAEEDSKAKDLLLRLHTNTARAANASGNPRLALAMCKQALALDENNAKAHWNRVLAWKIKGHPDRALGAARRASQLFANDAKTLKPFKIEIESLRKMIETEEMRLKDLHRMMGRAIFTPSYSS